MGVALWVGEGAGVKKKFFSGGGGREGVAGAGGSEFFLTRLQNLF